MEAYKCNGEFISILSVHQESNVYFIVTHLFSLCTIEVLADDVMVIVKDYEDDDDDDDGGGGSDDIYDKYGD